MEFAFQIAILIMSVVIHEVSHGYAASLLGDETARYEGRLTLNPLKHLDPIGSFLIPVLSYLSAGMLFGWAKPVPYNPYNLRPGRWSEAMVAAAGPASNLSVALIFSLFLRLMANGSVGWASPALLEVTSIIILINIVLAIFNLIPIPPLDGSKLLFALFPEKLHVLRDFYEKFGFILLLFFIFFLWKYLFPVVVGVFQLFTGIQF